MVKTRLKSQTSVSKILHSNNLMALDGHGIVNKAYGLIVHKVANIYIEGSVVFFFT